MYPHRGSLFHQCIGHLKSPKILISNLKCHRSPLKRKWTFKLGPRISSPKKSKPKSMKDKGPNSLNQKDSTTFLKTNHCVLNSQVKEQQTTTTNTQTPNWLSSSHRRGHRSIRRKLSRSRTSSSTVLRDRWRERGPTTIRWTPTSGKTCRGWRRNTHDWVG